MIAINEQDLWQRYRDLGDMDARDRLVERHMSLACFEARRFHRRATVSMPYDELLCAGAVGLLQSIERFDPTRGWRFSTYALPRIRGAMLDYVRSCRGIPRAAMDRAKRVSSARARLENSLGRAARETEVADALGVSQDEVRQWTRDCIALVPLSDEVDRAERVECPEVEITPPWLATALQRLPAGERAVIRLAFYEDMTHKEIAKALRLSESRVSQLRTQALARLRSATPAPMQVAV